MKKLIYLLFVSSLFIATSCKNDDEANSISNDEAAEVTGAAVGNTSGGAVSYIGTSVTFSASATSSRAANIVIPEYYVLANDSAQDNGTIYSAGTASNIGTWNYKWKYQHLLYINPNLVPQKVNSTFSYSGAVDVPRFKSTHLGNGSLDYTSLGTGAINLAVPGSYTVDSLWTLNGTFTREATHTSKISKKEIKSKTTITFNDCEVYTNGSKKIKSGTATVNVKGSVPKKGDFEYNGTITFNVNSVGILTIDGKTYTISTVTGEVIE